MGEHERSEPMRAAGFYPALALFPLPGTVFFPGTLLPLHVFEPRYRQLTRHVLEGDGLMAVALINGPDESIHDIAGLGRVVHSEALPDGRFHILLQGMGRVRIKNDVPGDMLFRRAQAEMIYDGTSDAISDVDREVKTLRAVYAELLGVCPEIRDALGDLPNRIKEPSALADIVCATAIEHPPARQSALEDTSITSRLRRASDALAGLLLANVEKSDPWIQ